MVTPGLLTACVSSTLATPGAGSTSLASAEVPPRPSAAVPVPEPLPQPATPADDPTCASLDIPELHAAVIVIPRPVWVAAMTPVLRAACACTRSGDHVRMVATLAPELGTAELVAPGSEATSACLTAAAVRFPAFDVGSDCIHCGPRRFGVFNGSRPPAPPAPPPSSTIAYPFTLLHP